jgi:hypothetical protein
MPDGEICRFIDIKAVFPHPVPANNSMEGKARRIQRGTDGLGD